MQHSLSRDPNLSMQENTYHAANTVDVASVRYRYILLIPVQQTYLFLWICMMLHQTSIIHSTMSIDEGKPHVH